jgi:hypothetical protein
MQPQNNEIDTFKVKSFYYFETPKVDFYQNIVFLKIGAACTFLAGDKLISKHISHDNSQCIYVGQISHLVYHWYEYSESK